MSRANRPPMALSRVSRFARGKESRIVVVVGTVTDDNRLDSLKSLKVCALRFTDSARARITKAGGECLTFDQLALRSPTGANTLLLRGPKIASRWKTNRHHGAAGVPNSRAAPYLSQKGRKFESARGKRHSRGFKV